MTLPERPRPECPDAGTLAAFVDGRLPESDRRDVETHLALCDACLEAVGLVVALGPAETTAPSNARDDSRAAPPAPARGRRLYAIVALATAATVVIGTWVGYARWFDVDRLAAAEIGAIAAATGAARFSTGRLSGDFEWGPAPQPTRGADRPALPPGVLSVLDRAEQLASRTRRASTLHAVAVARLAAGSLDTSLAAFEEAASADDASPDLHADFAAALLDRWAAGSVRFDAARALNHARIAAAADPSHRAALFNEALAHEALGSTDEAVRAWEAYLARDPASPWADEAGARLTRLRQPRSANRFLGDRYASVETALANWAAAIARGNAPIDLADAESTASRLAGSAGDADDAGDPGRAASGGPAGDAELRDMVREAASSASWPEARRACLVQLRQALAAWQASYDVGFSVSAAASADEARAAAACAGVSDDRAWLAWLLVRGSLRDAQNQQAMRDRERTAIGRGYARLAARLAEGQGVGALTIGRFSIAIDHLERALGHALRAGDPDLAAGLNASLANAYDELGDRRRAWTYRADALGMLTEVTSRRRRYFVLVTAAVDAADSGMPGTALALANALLTEARLRPNPGAEVMAHLNRSRALALIGRESEARDELAVASKLAANVGDTELQQQLTTEIRITTGRVLLVASPDVAVGTLTAALDQLGKDGNRFRLAHLLLLRGRAHLAAADRAGADADWERGVQVLEAERRELSSEPLRTSRLHEAFDIFQELTRLRADSPREALAVMERGHAREMLDAVADVDVDAATGDALRPLSADQLTGWLPDDVVAFAYAALPQELLVWRLQGGAVEMARLAIPIRTLTQMVDAHVAAIETGQADTSGLAPLLIPASLRTVGVKTTVFVPDGPLHRVAFPALRPAGTGRFIVQDTAPLVAPSLSALQRVTRRASAWSSAPAALIVGASAARPDEGMPALPGADEEIRALVRLYDRRESLTGAQATWDLLRRHLPGADVVHVAAHAVSEPFAPAESRLLLGDAASPADVRLGQLAEVTLRPGAVVVLAACDTARGQLLRGEGPMSLARPFLARGAGAVVGTLWKIRDGDSLALTTHFHERLIAGDDPAEALAASQRAMIARGVPAATWAAFSTVSVSLERR